MAVIDPRLTAVVKTEFALELQTQRVSELVKRIATNVDELLKRYDKPRDQVSAVHQPQPPLSAAGAAALPVYATDTCKHDADIIRRIDRLERKTQRSNRRAQREKGRIHYNSGNSGNAGNSGKNSRGGGGANFCDHCDYINRKLGANLETDHRKDRCPKKAISIKLIQDDILQSSSSSDSEGEQENELSDLYYLLSLRNDTSWTLPQSVVKKKIRRVV